LTGEDPLDLPNSGDYLTPCPFSSRYQVPVTQAWHSLNLFVAYRIGLGLLLAIPIWIGKPNALLLVQNTSLFLVASSAYLSSALIGIPMLTGRSPGFATQVQIQIVADIIIITILTKASGGVTSGIGVLLVCTVAAGGILAGGRCALGFAAMASIAVLTQEMSIELGDFPSVASATSAGLLGAAFFAIALLAMALSLRAEQSQLLAARHGHDLANLRHLNAFIVEHLQSGIIVLDEGHRVRMANPAAQRLLGLSASLVSLEQVTPAFRKIYFDWLDRDHEALGSLHGPDGQTVQVRFARLGASDSALRMVLLEDNTLFKQRVQHSKLTSLARLTASIAHEIRNPLSAIGHAAQLLNESAELGPEDRGLLEIILKHTKRVNEIIENILQISRRRSSQRECLELGPWVRRFLGDFAEEHQLMPSPFVLKEAVKNLKALADPSHLKQILENLCTNALKYGKPDRAGLEIVLQVDPNDAKPCLDVIDHGGGIDGRTAEQIFEPFFTTSGTGSGVGLYIARELAELNQARVDYRPCEDGSCFRVCLADGNRVAVEV